MKTQPIPFTPVFDVTVDRQPKFEMYPLVIAGFKLYKQIRTIDITRDVRFTLKEITDFLIPYAERHIYNQRLLVDDLIPFVIEDLLHQNILETYQDNQFIDLNYTKITDSYIDEIVLISIMSEAFNWRIASLYESIADYGISYALDKGMLWMQQTDFKGTITFPGRINFIKSMMSKLPDANKKTFAIKLLTTYDKLHTAIFNLPVGITTFTLDANIETEEYFNRCVSAASFYKTTMNIFANAAENFQEQLTNAIDLLEKESHNNN